MKVPGYGSYRDSGVEWVGIFPAHWTIEPLWAIAEECDRPNVGMIESNLLSLSYGRIVQKNINDNDGLLPASFETYQIVEPDDVVWRLTDLQNDKRSLRTARVPERGIITSAYLATRPHRVAPGYFSYLLRAYDLLKVFYSMGGGLRQGMKFSDVRRLPILLPPPPEQAAIAAFLDRETSKIDALIEAQRRLIALLKEKRQAVISHAVTKGLDRTVPMKESGVEWLGEVPAHWDVIKTLRHFRAAKGREAATLTKEYCSENAGKFPVYSGQTENDGVMGYLNRFEFDTGQGGYLLTTTVGAKAMTVIHISGQFSLSQNCMIIRPTNDAVSARFYYYHFQPTFSFHRSLIPDHMQPSFRMEDLYGFSVALPPLQEQCKIAAHLDCALNQYRELEAQAGASIALLQERRSALISAAVTGKIDVRGLVTEQAAAA